MRHLPFQKYKIEIPYTASRFEEMLIEELSRSKRHEKGFFKTTETVLKGEVRNRYFELYRRGFGNTSMIPKIKGHIVDTSDNKSSIIELKIIYNALTNIFLIFWFVFVGIIFVLSMINALVNWNFNIGIPVSIVMFLFAYGIIMLTF